MTNDESNPKSEFRSANEIRNPKEARNPNKAPVARCLRHSDFGFHSRFGIRISDLIRHSSFLIPHSYRSASVGSTANVAGATLSSNARSGHGFPFVPTRIRICNGAPANFKSYNFNDANPHIRCNGRHRAPTRSAGARARPPGDRIRAQSGHFASSTSAIGGGARRHPASRDDSGGHPEARGSPFRARYALARPHYRAVGSRRGNRSFDAGP